MRYLFIFICIFTLRADFLGNIYMELQNLNLSRDQRIELSDAIKHHHEFLRQWYIDFKKNNDDIMKSFANSSLSVDSSIITNSVNLKNERILAERDFLLSVYNILNKEQRVAFGAKTREREDYIQTLKDKFEDSKKLHQPAINGD